MDLPLVSPPKSTSVWADCHCSGDKISPGDHPPCKHPSPRPRMVINGVRLSHNKSNWVGYLCRREIYTSSYLMWLFYWVLSAVRMPFIYLFICLLIGEEGGGCRSLASIHPQSCQIRAQRRVLLQFCSAFYLDLALVGELWPDSSFLLADKDVCLIPETSRTVWMMSLIDVKGMV